MAWEARHEDLLAAIKILDLVPGKSGCPSSDCFRVHSLKGEKIRICTAGAAVADVKIQGIGKWPYEEPFYIDRRQLTPFVTIDSEIKKKHNFIFEAREGFMELSHGEREVRLNPQPPIQGYPELPVWKNPSELIIKKEFINLMECAATCAASDQKDAKLNCVYLLPTKKDVRMMANDNKSAIQIVTKMNIGFPEAAPFPLDMMKVVVAPGLVNVVWDSRCMGAFFSSESAAVTGTVWQMLSKKAADDFPVGLITKVFSEKEKQKVPEVCVVKASTMAKRVAHMAYYLQSVRKEEWILNISGKKNESEITLMCRLPHSRFKEVVRTTVFNPKDFALDWGLENIVPIFDHIGKDLQAQVHILLSDDKRTSYLLCGDLELLTNGKRQ